MIINGGSGIRELVPAAGRAPATFIFSELLNIAEGRQAF
jgi:hypothetical protein